MTLGIVSVLFDRKLVTFNHVVPLSKDADKISVDARALLKVAVMVCAAVLVMKSLELEPVSAENAATVTELVGAKVSPVMAKLLLAMLALLLASVKAPAATLITPVTSLVDAAGVKVAVQTLGSLVAAKSLSAPAPFDTVILEALKPVGADEKVNVMVAVSPILKNDLLLLIATPGDVTAVRFNAPAVPKLPATS